LQIARGDAKLLKEKVLVLCHILTTDYLDAPDLRKGPNTSSYCRTGCYERQLLVDY
jgi:hypothetical protein